MCGIAGIISTGQADLKVDLDRMIAKISHRGPDGEYVWTSSDGLVSLGHQRLAIIDLSDCGIQPMHFLNRYSIVHNGEIYNYKELRTELQGSGYQFKSQSDTEVILAAYDKWKEECLSRLDGMFAFAIWDQREKKLFAARDRFGQKPFYYHIRQNIFYFASEIKSIRSVISSVEINEPLLLLFLGEGSSILPADPAATFYSSILQLPPASCLTFEPLTKMDNLKVWNYWKINKDVQNQVTSEIAIAEFRNILENSVSRCFRSDISVGTSLSGGLDSSSITAIASSGNFDKNSYKAFTAAFPGFSKDESEFATRVATEFKLEHFRLTPEANELSVELDEFLIHQDEPVSSASVYAQYKVYQLASRQGIKVLLDGQGADEILAGYPKYMHWYLQELFRSHKSEFQRERKVLQENSIQAHWNITNELAARFPDFARTFLEKRAIRKIKSNIHLDSDFLESNLRADLIQKPVVRTLNDILHFNTHKGGLQQLLRYADRNSMAHGCEVRLPFLDHRLAEFVFSLPSTFKIHDGYTKWILRKSVENKLPSEIVWRKDKVGFEPPQKKWMENPNIQEMIRNSKEILVKKKILSPSVLHKKIQPHDAHAAESFDWRYLVAGRWIVI